MTGIDSNKIAIATIPFFGCLIIAILLISIFPEIVTSVPNWVMGVEKK
jgi:TRAP-type C4-dicarboxylate transport system permease large subunit